MLTLLASLLTAALPLGTASIASSGGTCAGSLATSSCRLATVTCSTTGTVTATLKVTEPASSATCTLLTLLGGGSSALYETTTYGGANYLTPALTAGCRIVQAAFASGAGGQGAWEGPARPEVAACWYATLIHAVHEDSSLYPADKSIPFVTHGQSGGSSGAAFALGWYGLGDDIDCATLSGGPPIGALDEGCMGDAHPVYGWQAYKYKTVATGASGFNNSPVSGYFVDYIYGDGRKFCALHSGGGAVDWRRSSLIGSAAETAFPRTKIVGVHGATDSSEAVPLGRYVLSQWTSLGLPIRWGSVASTDHTVADTSAGATDLYTATFGGIGSDGTAYGKCYPFHASSPAADYWVTKRRVISWGGENSSTLYAHSPSALQLPNGTLLALLMRGSGHGAVGTKVVLRRSTDDGATWGLSTLDEVTLASDPDTANFKMTDAVLSRLSSGRLVVTYIRVDNTLPTPSYPERQPGVVWSDDNGATWTSPAAITGTLNGTQFRVITGKLQEIGGSLCTTYYWRDLTENRYTASWACTTEAALTSWTHQTNIARAALAGGIQYEEPQVTRLQDGRLLALIRDDGTTASGETASGQIWKSYSSDNGATWGSVTAAYPGIGWPSMVVAGNGDVIAFTRKPSSNLSGRYSVYRVSTDSGATWSAEHILGDWSREISTYEYAGPFLRTDGKIGVAFAEDWYVARDTRTRNEYVEIERSTTGWRGWTPQSASINFPTLSAGSTLEALYDADPLLFDRATPSINTTSGTSIDVWPDLSGKGRDLRDDRTTGSQAANRFLFAYGNAQTHGVRRPGVVLRNVTSRMRTATWSPSISQPFAVLMSFATNDTADLNILGLDETSTARLGRDGFARLFLRNSSLVRWRTNTVSVPGRYVFAVLVNGASSVLRVNGSDSMLAGDGAAFASTTLTRLTLDASSTGSAQMTRSIVVLSNTNAASLRTDFDTVEAWMLARERPTE